MRSYTSCFQMIGGQLPLLLLQQPSLTALSQPHVCQSVVVLAHYLHLLVENAL